MKTGIWICHKCGKRNEFHYFQFESNTKTTDDAYELHLKVSPDCDAEGVDFQIEFAPEDKGDAA